VRQPGQTVESLFAERQPLYQRWAAVTVDCSGTTHEQAVEKIVGLLGG
jgi:shikimate kinase